MQHTTKTCFLCGQADLTHWAKATDVEYFTTKEYFSFNECPNCRLLLIDPVPEDQLSVIYPSNYYSFAGQKKSIVNSIKESLDKKLFRNILKDLPGNHLKVLDVGGGSGWLLDVIRSISPRVKTTQVVDIDPQAEQLAKEKGHQYFCGRIEDFDTAEQFDFVLLLNLIEHVADPLAVLKKIETILKPGGVVLIKTPNYDALDARMYRHRNWGGLHCPRHWVLFSKESFTKILSAAGLTMKSFSYTQGAPFWTVSVLAAMQRRGWVKMSAERPAYKHPLFPVFLGLFAAFDILRKPFAKTSQMFITVSK